MLNIKVKQLPEKNITIITLEGSMDAISGKTITNMVRGETTAGKKYFVMDMTKVDYINSMSVLDLLHTKDHIRFCNGILKICGVSQNLTRILKDIGLTVMLDFELFIEDAVNAINKETGR